MSVAARDAANAHWGQHRDAPGLRASASPLAASKVESDVNSASGLESRVGAAMDVPET